MDHTDAGNYYDAVSDGCLPCQKWQYTKKSCAAKNAAVAAADCHQIGAKEFDKKCMRKDVSKGKPRSWQIMHVVEIEFEKEREA